MKSHDNSSLGLRFAPVLARREAELRAILHASEVGQSERAERQVGVTDFKEISEEHSLEVVDDAKGDLAAHELEQVLAALHRLQEGRYGQCLDCGDAIDERRLTALPAAPYCIACQAIHEQGRTPSGARTRMHPTKATPS
jgi:DnaK suppressor protein